MSVNPGVCLLPGQVAEGSEPGKFFDSTLSVGLMFTPYIVYGTVLGLFTMNKTTLTADTGPDVGADWKRVIGHIYLNIRYLKKIYRKERYDDEGQPKEDFNLFDYLQKVWDSVNASTGHNHKFTLHCDLERPNHVSIIDLQFQQEEGITKEKLHVVKIQSNETICRDFQYDTTIPSGLSTTIAISVQNPDNINSIESATFAALSRNIKSRFHVPKDQEEVERPSDDLIYRKAAEYDNEIVGVRDKIDSLFEHRATMIKGKYQKTDEEGEAMKSDLISEQSRNLKTLYGEIQKVQTMYPWSNPTADVPYYKGFFKKKDYIPKVAYVIPLKFKAKFDGISGIVIGNVFRVDETRLPKTYQEANVGFIAMKESQEVTAGGDWTTQIEGQLIMLPGEEDIGERELAEFNAKNEKESGGFNNFDEDKPVNYVTGNEKDSGAYHGIITEEQRLIDPGMEQIQGNNERVYLKLGREATRYTSVRGTPEINNESFGDFGKDNMIGVFINKKGLFIGQCTEVTRIAQMNGYKFDLYAKTDDFGNFIGCYVKDGKCADEKPNLQVPWYKIQFAYKQESCYSNFRLGYGYDADGGIDVDGANWWAEWYTDVWNWYKFANHYSMVKWHRELYQNNDYYDGDWVMDYIKGVGYMRVDVLSANASFGYKREEIVTLLKTKGYGWGDAKAKPKIGDMFGFDSGEGNASEAWTYEDTFSIVDNYSWPANRAKYVNANYRFSGQHQDIAIDMILGWNNDPNNTPQPGGVNSYITIDDLIDNPGDPDTSVTN